jgi:hypothetical protein
LSVKAVSKPPSIFVRSSLLMVKKQGYLLTVASSGQ